MTIAKHTGGDRIVETQHCNDQLTAPGSLAVSPCELNKDGTEHLNDSDDEVPLSASAWGKLECSTSTHLVVGIDLGRRDSGEEVTGRDAC